MSATANSNPETNSGKESSALPRVSVRFRVYLGIVVVLPLLLFLSVFFVARSDYFIRTSKREFWHSMEYQFADRPKHCDVLIFGDSTGLMGADPKVIEQRTGMSACNIAVPYIALSTTGNLTLDHFLATHDAPRFIVMEVHPSHLRPPAFDYESGIIDGFLLADRKLPPIAAAKLFLAHPKDSFYFAAQVWKELIGFTPTTTPDLSEKTYQKDTALLAANDGFYSTGRPGGTPECGDQFPPPTFSKSYVTSYDKYKTRGTRILFWPSPVRHCDAHLADYRIGAAFLGVHPPLLLDDDAFQDAQHLTSVGSEENSEAISSELLKMEQAEGTQ